MAMSATAAPAKKRRTRSSPKARPAYVIIQVLGEDNQPMAIDKNRIRVVGVERNAEAVVSILLGEEQGRNVVLQVQVPPTIVRAGAPTPQLAA